MGMVFRLPETFLCPGFGATSLNIPVVGSLGVLLMLKQEGCIKGLSDVLSILQERGYWYQPELVTSVLQRAGELPH